MHTVSSAIGPFETLSTSPTRLAGYCLAPDTRAGLAELLAALYASGRTAAENGRTVRNLFARTLTRQANRLEPMPSPTRDDLCAIATADIPWSEDVD